LIKNMGSKSFLSVGLDEFGHLLWFGKKSPAPTKAIEKHRISIADDKYENKIISQRK
jgi:hypothetical protein